jgi:ubiquinone/menaquinone biosynthesis C-methylase UbiE
MDPKELAAQLRKPEGETGLQVGLMMNKGNEMMNLQAIANLHPSEGDKILEIGMGNGRFVKNILELNDNLSYRGLDFSSLMTDEAKIINKEFTEAKRANFITGEASEIPFPGGFFNRIMTVNTIYFWGDAEMELKEMKRVLAPGGHAVVAIRPRSTLNQLQFSQHGFRLYDENELEQLLMKNGWKVKKIEKLQEPEIYFMEKNILMEFIIAVIEPT